MGRLALAERGGLRARDREYDDYTDVGAFPPTPVPDWLVDVTIGAAVLTVSGLVALILAVAP